MRIVPEYKVVTHFRDEYEFLSNFYKCTIRLQKEGTWYEYPSLENAYQAAKSSDFVKWKQLQDMSAAMARTVGQKIPLAANWENEKLQVMEVLLRIKFSNPLLRDLLKGTGKSYLIEGNAWGDKFWGFDMRTGLGQNMLGQLLMQIRSEL